jgi:cytidylate kinase
MSFTYEILKKQNAETTHAILEAFEKNEDFLKLSKFEGDLTAKRDQEDGEKLQKGIDFAKEKGVLDPNFVPEAYLEIDVLGKNPEITTEKMLDTIKEKNGGSLGDGGFIIVLCGLSGTGKGTTMEALRIKLEEQYKKNVVMWSNGNVFRSLTLLASTWCEQQGLDGFDAEKALTKENLESFVKMLSFGEYEGKYDIRINGLGLDLLVSKIQNTELKSPKVSKNIPTVAEVTQGEAVTFAADAVGILAKAGSVVLLEGREQTVNYVPTPYRFTLVLSDGTLIGKRRAAQRLAADALAACSDTSTPDDVIAALGKALETMVKEVE